VNFSEHQFFCVLPRLTSRLYRGPSAVRFSMLSTARVAYNNTWNAPGNPSSDCSKSYISRRVSRARELEVERGMNLAFQYTASNEKRRDLSHASRPHPNNAPTRV